MLNNQFIFKNFTVMMTKIEIIKKYMYEIVNEILIL
jgi:hypothetical protein